LTSGWIGPDGHVICYPIGGALYNIFAGHVTDQWVDESWAVPSSVDELLDVLGARTVADQNRVGGVHHHQVVNPQQGHQPAGLRQDHRAGAVAHQHLRLAGGLARTRHAGQHDVARTVADEQTVHVHRDAIAVVGGLFLLPQRFRDDAEHRAAVEPEDAVAEDLDLETTDAHESSMEKRRSQSGARFRAGGRSPASSRPRRAPDVTRVGPEG